MVADHRVTVFFSVMGIELLPLTCTGDLQQKYSKNTVWNFLLKIPYTTTLIEELKATKTFANRKKIYCPFEYPSEPTMKKPSNWKQLQNTKMPTIVMTIFEILISIAFVFESSIPKVANWALVFFTCKKDCGKYSHMPSGD